MAPPTQRKPSVQQQTPSQIASQGLPSEESDVNLLFEKYTVDEIRAIEKRTRQNIERKKEDLRVMVGERYRDLIEAADTISEMTMSADNVMNSISQMQTYCKDLSESHLVKGVGFNKNSASVKKKKDTQFFSIAVQIKLLLDTPEKVWSAIDDGSFLRASQLYLLAKHVHTQLYTEPKLIARIDQLFPVLPRQWAAISHFKATILNGCRAALKNTNLSEKCICDSLCAIVLLEDSNPRQVFNEFLLARTNAVEQYFHPDQHISIKDQICEIVKLITNTVNQIYALFYDGHDLLEDEKLNEVNMLKHTLHRATQQETAEQLMKNTESGSVLAHLPPSVRNFKPSLTTTTLSTPQDQVQEKCQHWLDSCSHGISTGIGKLLQYINNVQHLAAIRNDLWQLLSRDGDGQLWDERCQHVLDKRVNVWDDYFRQLFFNRTKTILENHFTDAVSMLTQNLDKLLRDVESSKDLAAQYERDLSVYIWTESSADVPQGSAWTVARTRPLKDSGGLAMKAKAYTPSTQHLCKQFDSKLLALLDDSKFYSESEDSQNTDRLPVYTVLQETCVSSLDRFLDHVTRVLVKCGEERCIDKALVCGRVCVALCELCPRLQDCMLSDRDVRRTVRRADDPQFVQLKTRILEKSYEAFSHWSAITANQAATNFNQQLLNASLLNHCTRWDEIVIEEETEEGSSLKSTIRVPMQPSPYIHHMLYSICMEINRAGGHSFMRQVLEDLVENLLSQVLSSYQKLTEESLTQNRALQYIFDIKYLLSILSRKTDSNALKIVDALEASVDPFDLDVFSPHLSAHLNKLLYRTSILYGALISADRVIAPTRAGNQEQHNPLPMCGTQQRFALLPVTAHSRPATEPVSAKLESERTVKPETASFYNKIGSMGTIWFSNISGGK